ncbi:spore coat protein CotF [Rhizobium sp. BK181]|nr:spore coat protein CotF [Rhizobium sp. BK181]
MQSLSVAAHGILCAIDNAVTKQTVAKPPWGSPFLRSYDQLQQLPARCRFGDKVNAALQVPM